MNKFECKVIPGSLCTCTDVMQCDTQHSLRKLIRESIFNGKKENVKMALEGISEKHLTIKEIISELASANKSSKKISDEELFRTAVGLKKHLCAKTKLEAARDN